MRKMAKYIICGLVGLCGLCFISQNIFGETVYEADDVNCRTINKMRVCNDRNGKPINGILKIYNASHVLREEVIFKEGKQNGIAKSYYESGALRYEINFTDGKEDGIAKSYYESGVLAREEYYEDGILVNNPEIYNIGK